MSALLCKSGTLSLIAADARSGAGAGAGACAEGVTVRHAVTQTRTMAGKNGRIPTGYIPVDPQRPVSSSYRIGSARSDRHRS